MVRGTSWKISLAAAAITLASSACSGAPSPDDLQSEDALIGGGASSAAHAAVGALVEDDAVFCTATLVAPRYIVTALHCVEGGSEEEPAKRDPARVELRLGKRADVPARAVRLRRWLPAPQPIAHPDGSSPYVSDVVLAELEGEIRDVPPIPLSRTELSRSELGAAFEVVGFGVRAKDGSGAPGGKREAGKFVLEAMTGNALAQRFGSRAAFDSFYAGIDPEGAADGVTDRLWSIADLVEPYEVLARSERTETCFADSGGPLIRVSGRTREVVGVVSRGFPGYASMCMPLGTVFAVFGPSTAALLSTAVWR